VLCACGERENCTKAGLASGGPKSSYALMNLPPLRTLFFEDLSVGMTDFAVFAGSSRSTHKHATRWRSSQIS